MQTVLELVVLFTDETLTYDPGSVRAKDVLSGAKNSTTVICKHNCAVLENDSGSSCFIFAQHDHKKGYSIPTAVYKYSVKNVCLHVIGPRSTLPEEVSLQ